MCTHENELDIIFYKEAHQGAEKLKFGVASYWLLICQLDSAWICLLVLKLHSTKDST